MDKIVRISFERETWYSEWGSRRFSAATLVFGAALVFSSLACKEASKPVERGVTVGDSAGITIVHSRRPVWTSETAFRLLDSPEILVPPEFAPGRFLAGVGEIHIFSDGGWVAENRRPRELLIFDPSGRLIRTLGGMGSGPGEFRAMRGLYPCDGGRLVEVDIGRLTIFDAEGAVDEVVRLPDPVIGAGNRVRGVSADCGSVWITTVDGTNYRATGFGTHSHMIRLKRVDLVPSAEVFEAGLFRGRESIADVSGQPGMMIPFARDASWASDGVRVYYGWGNAPQLFVLSGEGRVERIIRWDAQAMPITADHWALYERYRAERVGRDPRMRRIYATREQHPRPNALPFFAPWDEFDTPIRIGDEGNLWVRRFEPSRLLTPEAVPAAEHWSVLDDQGRWLGDVRAPPGFEIRAVAGVLVFGVARDALGVESIQVYRMATGNYEAPG